MAAMKTVVLAMCVVLAAGCASNKAAQTPSPEIASSSHPDEVIGREVRFRIETLCPGDAPAMKIIVSDGVVTLQGAASSQAVAWRAQAAATAVRGVKTVRNELLVRW
jgi:osmotically-inducible protein OsmY